MIRVNEPYVAGNVPAYVQAALDSGWLSPGGPFSRKFKQALEAVCGGYVTLANSGTSALEVALRAVAQVTGVTAGDVIVPAYTCPDTAIAVLRAGFRPVFADVDPLRLGLTADTLRSAVTEQTVGVMPVHIYGMGCPLAVYQVARELGLFIVDDAAEAFGVTVAGVAVTDLADAVGYSLRGDKLLPVGTGGVIATKHQGIAGAAAAIIGLNSPRGPQRYHSLALCLSYEFPELLAALGLAQLEAFPAAMAKRWEVVAWYVEAGLPSRFAVGDVPWKFPVTTRNAVQALTQMAAQGIEVSPPFVPLHRLRFLAERVFPVVHQGQVKYSMDCPHVTEAARYTVALPLHPRMTPADVAQVVAALVEVADE